MDDDDDALFASVDELDGAAFEINLSFSFTYKICTM